MYSASFYFLLSWVDTRAPGEVAAATAAIEADPTKTCERLCNRQRQAAPGALCCDTLWLPTVTPRNINEFPQGRTQPSHITVTPEGVVTWRVEMRADLYTTLDLVAFPFDRQSLDMVLQILGQRGEAAIRVIPSATGTKLFLAGTGDDLSRFTVEGLRIYAHEPAPWSEQFNDPKLKNLRTFSAWDDPAPVVPLPAGALLPNGTVSRAPRRMAYGADFTVTEVVIAISELKENAGEKKDETLSTGTETNKTKNSPPQKTFTETKLKNSHLAQQPLRLAQHHPPRRSLHVHLAFDLFRRAGQARHSFTDHHHALPQSRRDPVCCRERASFLELRFADAPTGHRQLPRSASRLF